MTQYKLLILQTACQFSGMAWLHYDTTFPFFPAASGQADWSCMNTDLYNFHTRLPQQHQYQPPTMPSSLSRSVPSSSIFYRSWNNGSCFWPYGQCRYCHSCEKCEGEHPSINCPFWASPAQPSWSSTPPRKKNASSVETMTGIPTSSVYNVQLCCSFSPSHCFFPNLVNPFTPKGSAFDE